MQDSNRPTSEAITPKSSQEQPILDGSRGRLRRSFKAERYYGARGIYPNWALAMSLSLHEIETATFPRRLAEIFIARARARREALGGRANGAEASEIFQADRFVGRS